VPEIATISWHVASAALRVEKIEFGIAGGKCYFALPRFSIKLNFTG